MKNRFSQGKQNKADNKPFALLEEKFNLSPHVLFGNINT